ncbi:hypothetical protein LXL04_026639 [Taraxacum kok-saghyz]
MAFEKMKLPLPIMGLGELTGMHKRELVDWTKVTTFTSFWTNGANETHFGLNCTGCSRSLYTMDLCSANGFGKIKTILHNTSFTQAIPGLKVFIIEECQSLTMDTWDELMRFFEGPYGMHLGIETEALKLIVAKSIKSNVQANESRSNHMNPSSFYSSGKAEMQIT